VPLRSFVPFPPLTSSLLSAATDPARAVFRSTPPPLRPPRHSSSFCFWDGSEGFPGFGLDVLFAAIALFVSLVGRRQVTPRDFHSLFFFFFFFSRPACVFQTPADDMTRTPTRSFFSLTPPIIKSLSRTLFFCLCPIERFFPLRKCFYVFFSSVDVFSVLNPGSLLAFWCQLFFTTFSKDGIRLVFLKQSMLGGCGVFLSLVTTNAPLLVRHLVPVGVPGFSPIFPRSFFFSSSSLLVFVILELLLFPAGTTLPTSLCSSLRGPTCFFFSPTSGAPSPNHPLSLILFFSPRSEKFFPFWPPADGQPWFYGTLFDPPPPFFLPGTVPCFCSAPPAVLGADGVTSLCFFGGSGVAFG